MFFKSEEKKVNIIQSCVPRVADNGRKWNDMSSGRRQPSKKIKSQFICFNVAAAWRAPRDPSILYFSLLLLLLLRIVKIWMGPIRLLIFELNFCFEIYAEFLLLFLQGMQKEYGIRTEWEEKNKSMRKNAKRKYCEDK